MSRNLVSPISIVGKSYASAGDPAPQNGARKLLGCSASRKFAEYRVVLGWSRVHDRGYEALHVFHQINQARDRIAY